MTDFLFKNARIVDGSGSPWFRGSVKINDGKITSVNKIKNPADSADAVLNLDGNILCPGFIDTHSHSDLVLFNSLLEPKVRQGITTEILGQDGFSMAPMYPGGGSEQWRRQLRALTGQVDVNWSWESISEYLDAIETAGIVPNVGTLVGHGTVRFNVLGMDDRPPTDGELEEMAELVTEGLEEGAIGFSTGLVYTPCTYADRDEVQQLAAELQPYGRPFVAHIRSEGRWIWDALDEFVDIGAEEEIPLHLSHFKIAGTEQQGKAKRALHLVETARERGVDFTAEQYPYTAGSTMLSAALPPWVHSDGPDAVLQRLKNDQVRDRIHRDIEQWRIDGWENLGARTGWDNVIVANTESDDNTDLEGKSIATIANQRDIKATDVVCDLLLEEELGISIISHALAEEDVQEILTHEFVCIGTDGLFGGKPHPRLYGTYPRILGRYVRKKNLLSFEGAIRKMTSLPARIMGLKRKGFVRPGMDADLVVINPTRVGSNATFDNPRQYPEGIKKVLVNGELVYYDREMTGATPGTALRACAE